MALISPIAASVPPQALTLATPAGSPAGSDTVAAQDRLALLVHNPTGGALNVNIGTPDHLDVYGVQVDDIVVSVPANAHRLIALPRNLADSDGLIDIGAASGILYRPVTI